MCKSPLHNKGSAYSCSQNHHFDLAKQGYVNLLLANQKRSREPGDSKDMMVSRSEFLNAGNYDFLVEKLKQVIGSDTALSIIDIGCGEGFYLKKLAQYFGEHEKRLFGIDISKSGIKLSALQNPNMRFAVASCVDIPVRDDAIDVALSIFAPTDTAELKRILKPTGRIIRVAPGPNHLRQLKQHLYKEVHLHEKPEAYSGSEILLETTISDNVDLRGDAIVHLLQMTPLNWRGNQEAKERLLTQDILNIDFEFVIQEMKFKDTAHNE